MVVTSDFLAWLEREAGYKSCRDLGDGRYAAIMPLMFTAAIITGPIGDYTGYTDRWCYHSLDGAQRAMDEWDGTGEPEGWHRHPNTGRRRDSADPELEYINF